MGSLSASSSKRGISGILDVHVHHASGLQSMNSFGDHDVFVRFMFGDRDPLSDAILQTKTVRKGGIRPNFDQSFQIGIPLFEDVLKCEVVMAQPRGQEKVIGFADIPLGDLIGSAVEKQKYPMEFRLFKEKGAEATGSLTLTLAYHQRNHPKKQSDLRPPSFLRSGTSFFSQASEKKVKLTETVSMLKAAVLASKKDCLKRELPAVTSSEAAGQIVIYTEAVCSQLVAIPGTENCESDISENLNLVEQKRLVQFLSEKGSAFEPYLSPVTKKFPSIFTLKRLRSAVEAFYVELSSIPECEESLRFSSPPVLTETNLSDDSVGQEMPILVSDEVNDDSPNRKRCRLDPACMKIADNQTPSASGNDCGQAQQQCLLDCKADFNVAEKCNPLFNRESLLDRIRKCTEAKKSTQQEACTETNHGCNSGSQMKPFSPTAADERLKKLRAMSLQLSLQSSKPEQTPNDSDNSQEASPQGSAPQEPSPAFTAAPVSVFPPIECFPMFSKLPSLHKLVFPGCSFPSNEPSISEASQNLQHRATAYKSLLEMPKEKREEFTQMVMHHVATAQAMEGSRGEERQMNLAEGGSIEQNMSEEAERIQGWKQFCEQLDNQRKETATKTTRYGSHAFF